MTSLTLLDGFSAVKKELESLDACIVRENQRKIALESRCSEYRHEQAQIRQLHYTLLHEIVDLEIAVQGYRVLLSSIEEANAREKSICEKRKVTAESDQQRLENDIEAFVIQSDAFAMEYNCTVLLAREAEKLAKIKETEKARASNEANLKKQLELVEDMDNKILAGKQSLQQLRNELEGVEAEKEMAEAELEKLRVELHGSSKKSFSQSSFALQKQLADLTSEEDIWNCKVQEATLAEKQMLETLIESRKQRGDKEAELAKWRKAHKALSPDQPKDTNGGTTPGSSQYLQPSNHASGPLITIVDQEACPVNNPPAPAQGPYGSMMTVQEPDSPPKEKDNSNSCKGRYRTGKRHPTFFYTETIITRTEASPAEQARRSNGHWDDLQPGFGNSDERRAAAVHGVRQPPVRTCKAPVNTWPSQDCSHMPAFGMQPSSFMPASTLWSPCHEQITKLTPKALNNDPTPINARQHQIRSAPSASRPRCSSAMCQKERETGRGTGTADLIFEHPGALHCKAKDQEQPSEQQHKTTWPQDGNGGDRSGLQRSSIAAAVPPANKPFPWPAQFLKSRAQQKTVQDHRYPAVNTSTEKESGAIHEDYFSQSRLSRDPALENSMQAGVSPDTNVRASRARGQRGRVQRIPKKPLKRAYPLDGEERGGGTDSSGDAATMSGRIWTRGPRSRGRGRRVQAAQQIDKDTFGGVRHR